MAEDDRYFVQLRDGGRYGPAARPTLLQWAREGRIPPQATLVRHDHSEAIDVMSDPELASIVQAPPTVSTGVRPPAPQSTWAIIPTGNPMALIGYYLAVFGLLVPGLGLVAIVFGVLGLRRVHRYPAAKGTAHAWIALLGGAIVTLLWTLIIVGLTRI